MPDGIIIGKIGYNEARFLSGILWRRRLSEPRHAAAHHKDLRAGSEKVERDGAPDIPRRSCDQGDALVQAHLFRPQSCSHAFR